MNAIDLQTDATLNVSTGAATQTGVISGGFSIDKTGAGMLTLAGANTYMGGTTISDGTLSVSSDGNLGDASGTVTFQGPGGTLRLDSPTLQVLAISRAFVTDGADAVFEVADNGFRVRGGISGDGSLVVNGSGNDLFLSNIPSTFSGSTTANNGLGIESNEMLPDSTDVIVNDTLILQLDVTETIGSLSGAGSVRFVFGMGNHLIVGQNNTNTVFSGRIIDFITGSGALTKIGTGTLTLSGNSSDYSEGTTVSGGTLLANNTSGSATGTGAVTVNNGGTLGGTGSVSGTVTVNAGGTVAPGVSPGILTVGAVSFTAGSILDTEIASGGGVPGTDHDQLAVTGAANLDGSLFANMGFTPAHQVSFQVIAFGSRNGVFTSVTDSGLPDCLVMAPFYTATDLTLSVELLGDANLNGTVDAADYTVWANGFGTAEPSYDDGDLNRDGSVDAADYTIWANKFGTVVVGPSGPAAVPEPSTFALLLIAAVGLIAARRRSRR